MRNWSTKRKVAVTALAFVVLMVGWIFWWNASQPEPKSDNPSAYVTPSEHTPAPAPTTSADTAQPSTPKNTSADSVVVGAVSVTLPFGYEVLFDDQVNSIVDAVGTDQGMVGTRPFPGQLRLSTGDVPNRLDDFLLDTSEGRCTQKDFFDANDYPLVGGYASYLSRIVYDCPEGVFSYANWQVTDPNGPAFYAEYVFPGDRQPGELTTAFEQATWLS